MDPVCQETPLKRETLQYTALGFFPAASSFIIVPMLPSLLRMTAGLTTAEIGNWISLWILLGVISQWPARHLVLFWSKTKWSPVLCVMATLAFPLSIPSGNMVLSTLCYCIGAISLSVLSLLSIKLCEVAGSGRARAFSFLYMGTNCGAIAAPFAAGFLADSNPLYALTVIGLLRLTASGSVAILVWLAGVTYDESRPSSIRSNTSIFQSSRHISWLLCTSTLYSFLFSQLIYTSQIIISTEYYGFHIASLIVTLNASLSLLLQPIFLLVKDRLANRQMITLGAGFALVGWTLPILLPSALAIILLTILFTTAEIFILPSSMALVAELVPAESRLSAYTIYGFTRLGGPVGVAAGAHLFTSSGEQAFASVMVSVGLGMFICAIMTSYRSSSVLGQRNAVSAI